MGPAVVLVPLVVEVQTRVEVLGDDVDQVHRTWNPDVEVRFQVWVE